MGSLSVVITPLTEFAGLRTGWLEGGFLGDSSGFRGGRDGLEYRALGGGTGVVAGIGWGFLVERGANVSGFSGLVDVVVSALGLVVAVSGLPDVILDAFSWLFSRFVASSATSFKAPI